MCGIFAYLSSVGLNHHIPLVLKKAILESFTQEHHRGPDNSIIRTINDNVLLGFHRLSIMDTSNKGDQPFVSDNSPKPIYLICNGEIYNHSDLEEKYQFQYKSGSDCESILHMYQKWGIERTVKELDGVFAFVIYDSNTEAVYCARDPIGVRSMYLGCNIHGIGFASELKSLHKICEHITTVPPGNYIHIDLKTDFDIDKNINKLDTLVKFKGHIHRYYEYEYPMQMDDESTVMENIRNLFINSVDKRMMSDRPVGCLLSGGLDSSLVTALVARKYEKGKLHTFSVGLPGAEDLKYAKIVSDFVGTIHHEIILTEQEMLDAVEHDIWQIETWDTTTIRASTPMLLMCEYIKKHTDITVIYSGEGSDEASGSYLYFHNAPDSQQFQKECVRLIHDLEYFDVLRCDKSTAGAGLEVRVPFLDKDFLQYYMSIDPKMKQPREGSEKWLLRKSFESMNILPKEVLWRMKEGLSDGCSSLKKSWYTILQEQIEDKYTQEDLEMAKKKYHNNPPLFKEALYYRETFNKFYEGRDDIIPYYWLPKWSGDIVEPSARVLNVYHK